MVLDPVPGSELAALGLTLNPSHAEILTAKPEVVVLAVKPQMAAEVLADLREVLPADALAMSIMAGLSVERLAQLTGLPAVVRTMPNTPLAGQGPVC